MCSIYFDPARTVVPSETCFKYNIAEVSKKQMKSTENKSEKFKRGLRLDRPKMQEN